MKKWVFLLAALAWFSPVKGTDVGKLLPVELVSLRLEGENLRVETDTGNFGTGQTLAQAMEDLKGTAAGEIFLETADYLVLSPGTENCWQELSAYFRPGTLVFQAQTPIAPEAAAEYLRSRDEGTALNRMGEEPLPIIKTEEGRVELEK